MKKLYLRGLVLLAPALLLVSAASQRGVGDMDPPCPICGGSLDDFRALVGFLLETATGIFTVLLAS